MKNAKSLNEDLTPGLAMEDHDNDNENQNDEEAMMTNKPKFVVPSYEPAWRPPTPPPTHESESNTTHNESSLKSSSWLSSLLPKRKDGDSSTLKNHPPDYAFSMPNITPSRSDDSQVDESLLLQDESELMNRPTSSTLQSSTKSGTTNRRKKSKIRNAIINKLIPNNDQENDESLPMTGTSATTINDEEDEEGQTMNANYQMMDDHQIPIKTTTTTTTTNDQPKSSKRRKNKKRTTKKLKDFFFSGMDEIEATHTHHQQSNWTTNYHHHDITSSHHHQNDPNQQLDKPTISCEYFTNPQSKQIFLQEYHTLNSKSMDEEQYNNAEDRFELTRDELEDENDEDYDDFLDFKTLFTFGCSPTSREKELNRRGLTADDGEIPAISDIRKSSLSYMVNGRVQIKLPSDRVRLVMDEDMDPGILSVEKNAYDFNTGCSAHAAVSAKIPQHQRHLEIEEYNNNDEMKKSSLIASDDQEISTPLLPSSSSLSSIMSTQQQSTRIRPSDNNKTSTSNITELNYVLSIDPDLYKRVLSEAVDSRMPCGLYYCCHDYESKNVNIHVAIGILIVVFGFILWGTCIWPTE